MPHTQAGAPSRFSPLYGEKYGREIHAGDPETTPPAGLAGPVSDRSLPVQTYDSPRAQWFWERLYHPGRQPRTTFGGEKRCRGRTRRVSHGWTARRTSSLADREARPRDRLVGGGEQCPPFFSRTPPSLLPLALRGFRPGL